MNQWVLEVQIAELRVIPKLVDSQSFIGTYNDVLRAKETALTSDSTLNETNYSCSMAERRNSSAKHFRGETPSSRVKLF